MTELAKRKTIIRAETKAQIRRAPIIIQIDNPYTIKLREKGRRTVYEVDWESVFWLAVKKHTRGGV